MSAEELHQRLEETRAERRRVARDEGLGPELREVQNRIRQLAEGVIDDTVDEGRASVAFQGLGVYVRSVEMARTLREAEELEPEDRGIGSRARPGPLRNVGLS